MIESTVLLVVMKTLTLVFGGMLTYLAYKAYRRTGSPALRALSVGIGLVTAGAILGGVIHQFLNLPLELSVSVQSVFTAVGFAVLTYSLYTGPTTQRSDTGPRTRSGQRPGGRTSDD